MAVAKRSAHTAQLDLDTEYMQPFSSTPLSHQDAEEIMDSLAKRRNLVLDEDEKEVIRKDDLLVKLRNSL